MQLEWIDWIIVAAVIATSVIIGLVAGRRSGDSSSEFFLSGRTLPWWLLGFSMVATTFSTDTPNLVTDLTRTNGVAGNWLWWAFLLTGATTTFFFAHLWRRSGVMTDIEFYEARYGGKPAAFLRIVRALYIGLLFNILMMAAVTLAATKFGAVLLGVSPLTTVLVAGTATVIFSAYGGLKGVLYSDLFLFVIAIIGAYAAASIALDHPQIGSLHALFEHPAVAGKTDFIPNPSDPTAFLTLLVLPLLVQWWSVWYPGSEPGGGGYVAQRMLAARNERHAIGAMIFFNIAHYALRPWPWIIVALASLIVFPDLDSLRRAFPEIDPSVIGNDMAYPAMLTFLPTGWLGLIAASLIAAYMSTMATQLNLGSAYFVTDIYGRFLKPDATEADRVRAGRIATVILMIISGSLALVLHTAGQTFQILLSVGAGTGLLFMMRWYWHRVNAWSEISAMIISLAVSLTFQFVPALEALPVWTKLVAAVGITTIGWLVVTLATPREDAQLLQQFYDRVRPAGPGWKAEAALSAPMDVDEEHNEGIGAMLIASISCIGTIYGLLFGIGAAIKSDWIQTAAWIVIGTVSAVILAITMLRRAVKPTSGMERSAASGQPQVAKDQY